MTALTMNPRDESFIISEANGSLSRDAIAFAAPLANALSAGTLLYGVTSSDGLSAPLYSPATIDPETSQIVSNAVLLRSVPAGATKGSAITRQAEVDDSLLVWPADATDDQKSYGANLLSQSIIIVR